MAVIRPSPFLMLLLAARAERRRLHHAGPTPTTPPTVTSVPTPLPVTPPIAPAALTPAPATVVPTAEHCRPVNTAAIGLRLASPRRSPSALASWVRATTTGSTCARSRRDRGARQAASRWDRGRGRRPGPSADGRTWRTSATRLTARAGGSPLSSFSPGALSRAGPGRRSCPDSQARVRGQPATTAVPLSTATSGGTRRQGAPRHVAETVPPTIRSRGTRATGPRPPGSTMSPAAPSTRSPRGGVLRHRSGCAGSWLPPLLALTRRAVTGER